MADRVRAGSDVSAGTYMCTECGYHLLARSTTQVPPCPCCNKGLWSTVSGGGSIHDSYLGRR
jgi:ribosomal protein L37AE/L43A